MSEHSRIVRSVFDGMTYVMWLVLFRTTNNSEDEEMNLLKYLALVSSIGANSLSVYNYGHARYQ
jgi:hypothetical protein